MDGQADEQTDIAILCATMATEYLKTMQVIKK